MSSVFYSKSFSSHFSPQKEVKYAATTSRVNLRQQLARQQLDDEQKKDSKEHLQHVINSVQGTAHQAQAIVMPTVLQQYQESPVQVKVSSSSSIPIN